MAHLCLTLHGQLSHFGGTRLSSWHSLASEPLLPHSGAQRRVQGLLGDLGQPPCQLPLGSSHHLAPNTHRIKSKDKTVEGPRKSVHSASAPHSSVPSCEELPFSHLSSTPLLQHPPLPSCPSKGTGLKLLLMHRQRRDTAWRYCGFQQRPPAIKSILNLVT